MSRWTALLVALFGGHACAADAADLRFAAVGPGLYEFNTGVIRGRLKVDGKYQGLYPLYDIATGVELTHAPGMFSPYHVFTAGRELGVARDWPTETRLLPSGSVEVRWPSATTRPVAMVAEYRLAAPDTVDFLVTITPRQDVEKFELFLSSYLTKALRFEASVHLPDEAKTSGAGFVTVASASASGRHYVMFPRDPKAILLIGDGRWKGLVDWEIGPRYSVPLMVRRERRHGFTTVMMTPPKDSFAIACPWNPATTDANVYRSFYQSLFGRDLKANESAAARCRLLIGRNLADAAIVVRYEDFAHAPARRPQEQVR